MAIGTDGDLNSEGEVAMTTTKAVARLDMVLASIAMMVMVA